MYELTFDVEKCLSLESLKRNIKGVGNEKLDAANCNKIYRISFHSLVTDLKLSSIVYPTFTYKIYNSLHVNTISLFTYTHKYRLLLQVRHYERTLISQKNVFINQF